MRRPLDGVHVLELGYYMAGPFCGMLLADLGADVVKIENPKVGDYARLNGPFAKGSADGAGFLRLNRGKRSVALDLKQDAARDAFRALVRRADVLVENYRPGTLDDLGVGYSSLSRTDPRLVYVAISGFGQTGPQRERPGLDLIVQAESGLMSITGEPDGAPVKVGVPLGDLTSGLYAALAAVSALRERDRTGRGTFIDLSLHDAALSLGIWESGAYWTTGEIPRPLGSAHRADAPYQAFATKDGHIVVGATGPKNWAAFKKATGLEERLAGEQWETPHKRRQAYRELARIIEEVTRTRTTDDWIRDFSAEGVPCGRIRNYAQVLRDPETRRRGMVTDIEHPVLGAIPSLGSPLHFDGENTPLGRAAPLLGEHTREVLAGVIGEDGVERLIRDGAASQA